MLLTVEDNAEAEKPAPDAIPSVSTARHCDMGSERRGAKIRFGRRLTWIATDAERDDDKGISSQPRESGQCEGFHSHWMSSKSCQRNGGDIQVKP